MWPHRTRRDGEILLDQTQIQIALWIFAVLWLLRVGWAVVGRKASLPRLSSQHIIALIAMIAKRTNRRMGGHYASAEDTAPAHTYVNYRKDIEEV